MGTRAVAHSQLAISAAICVGGLHTFLAGQCCSSLFLLGCESLKLVNRCSEKAGAMRRVLLHRLPARLHCFHLMQPACMGAWCGCEKHPDLAQSS
jgi:hypothetical protein